VPPYLLPTDLHCQDEPSHRFRVLTGFLKCKYNPASQPEAFPSLACLMRPWPDADDLVNLDILLSSSSATTVRHLSLRTATVQHRKVTSALWP
jgi:hypothetical protein